MATSLTSAQKAQNAAIIRQITASDKAAGLPTNYVGVSQPSASSSSSGSSGLLKPGGAALLNTPSPSIGSSASGIVPQVYSGSTGTGSNQNVSTTSYGGFKPLAYTPPPIGGSGSATATKTPSNSTAFGESQIAGVGNLDVSGLFKKNTTTPTTFAGKPAYETSSYSDSSSGRASSTGTTTPEISKEDRAKRQEFLTQAEVNRQAQLSAIAAQKKKKEEELAAAQNAVATPIVENKEKQVPTDPSIEAPEAVSLSNIQNELEAINRSYEDALKPSKEEEEAQAAERELVAREQSIKAGVNRSAAAISEQPIPYGFITGQTAAIQRRANADLDSIAAERVPLQLRVANEQAKRKAAMDVARSAQTSGEKKLSRAEQLYDTSVSNRRADEKEEREKNKPFELSQGQTRYVYNPKTGQYDAVASVAKAPTPTKATPVTYSDTRSLPENIRNDILDDVVINRGTLDQLYAAYPEVSKSAIKSLYEAFSIQGKNLKPTTSGREI